MTVKRAIVAALWWLIAVQISHAAESAPEAAAGPALAAGEAKAYLAGHGMGLAMVAEHNGYPGPAHVLELADQLGLDEGQRERSKALVDAVRQDAQLLGEQIVATERELERLFAQGLARRETLGPLLTRLNSLQGELRMVHLEAHIAQREVLDDEQVAKYQRLRAEQHQHAGHGPMRHHH